MTPHLMPCPKCQSSARLETEIRDDNHRFPRPHWHGRIACGTCSLATGWELVSDQLSESENSSNSAPDLAMIEGIVSEWNTRTGDIWFSVELNRPVLGQKVLGYNPEYGQRETLFDLYPEGSIARENMPNTGYFSWKEPQSAWTGSWKPTHWKYLTPAPTIERSYGFDDFFRDAELHGITLEDLLPKIKQRLAEQESLTPVARVTAKQ